MNCPVCNRELDVGADEKTKCNACESEIKIIDGAPVALDAGKIPIGRRLSKE